MEKEQSTFEMILDTGEAATKNTKGNKKAEIGLELVKIRLRIGFDMRPTDYESHTLTAEPRTLNTSDTSHKKAENRC